MKQVAIGIDIGGTNTVLGLVDQNGNVLAKDYFSTAKYNNITEYTNKQYRFSFSLYTPVLL